LTDRLAAARTRLRRLTLGVHAGLLLALGSVLWQVGWRLPVFAIVTVLAALPLLATLPGLLADRSSTPRWLAVALVAYVGLATVEVIANGSLGAAAMLLLALLELGLLLLLIRTPRPR
jgi:uncharacterized membrane protein